jgi:hypothetical protein
MMVEARLHPWTRVAARCGTVALLGGMVPLVVIGREPGDTAASRFGQSGKGLRGGRRRDRPTGWKDRLAAMGLPSPRRYFSTRFSRFAELCDFRRTGDEHLDESR